MTFKLDIQEENTNSSMTELQFYYSIIIKLQQLICNCIVRSRKAALGVLECWLETVLHLHWLQSVRLPTILILWLIHIRGL